MTNQTDRLDRRHSTRIDVRGSVVIHRGSSALGQVLDLSAGGVRLQLAGRAAPYRSGDFVALEMRLDGRAGGWWELSGHIGRMDADGIAVVAFDDVPTDFEDAIQTELLAALEDEATGEHVLLVDPDESRRGEIANRLRARGRRVTEAATPLEMIAQLGEARAHPRVVAIADTVPESVADELRAYVSGEHGELRVVRMRTSTAAIDHADAVADESK